jgi:predicted HD phosphohydrolase
MHPADQLLGFLRAGRERGYIGEPVSQLEHALQAADRARRAHASPALVLAALFHDLGHLIAPDAPTMGAWGVQDHEAIGADLLARHGCSPELTEPIREHVRAKRYLCWKNPRYLARLSEASRATLAHQGGPMSVTEALAYAARPDLDAILAVRSWDELAKDPDAQVPPLESYRDMLIAHLERSA